MLSNKLPLVSVILPVFNSEKYIRESIESILYQTYENLEILIYNDGSTDKSLEIIKSYEDNRIKLFNSVNKGYLIHLNNGIRESRGKYIVRMDSDDVSELSRIEKQVSFMEANLDIGLCGTWIRVIDSPEEIKYETDSSKLKCLLFFLNPIVHPSVILRKSVLIANKILYNDQFYTSEDYHMWVEISKYSKIANYPEILLNYRRHNSQISCRQSFNQLVLSKLIRENQIETLLGYSPTNDEKYVHSLLFEYSSKILSYDDFIKLHEWLLFLLKNNNNFEHTYFKDKVKFYLKNRINGLQFESYDYNLLNYIYKSAIIDLNNYSIKTKLKFLIQCIFKIRL